MKALCGSPYAVRNISTRVTVAKLGAPSAGDEGAQWISA
jgi:hypothetical protein